MTIPALPPFLRFIILFVIIAATFAGGLYGGYYFRESEEAQEALKIILKDTEVMRDIDKTHIEDIKDSEQFELEVKSGQIETIDNDNVLDINVFNRLQSKISASQQLLDRRD